MDGDTNYAIIFSIFMYVFIIHGMLNPWMLKKDNYSLGYDMKGWKRAIINQATLELFIKGSAEETCGTGRRL